MGDIKLFRIGAGAASELPGSAVALEKSLQQIIERDLDAMLGIRFLASEYATGATHGGRIDTLGLDEDGSPVIIEYKRSTNENVINQGLFYLDRSRPGVVATKHTQTCTPDLMANCLIFWNSFATGSRGLVMMCKRRN